MDPVTHLLTGATLSRAGLNRTTGLATLTVTLAAEAPDMDVVLYLFGHVTGFAHHRGFTHTFLGGPFMAALVVAFVYLMHRLMRRYWREPKLAPRWPLLFFYAWLGTLSHILLDFTNNYGVRPLSPFLHRWWSWDIVFIIEPLITGALALALIAPAFFGMVGREIGARREPFPGRGWAIAALVWIVLLWGVRDHYHRRAVAELQSQTYLDEEPLRVAAYPYPVTPLRWYGIVETETAFHRMEVNLLRDEGQRLDPAAVRPKPEETPATLAAKSSRFGRVLLDWARFPVTEVEELPADEGGYRVRFVDLRYVYPGRESFSLGGYVYLDQNLKPVATARANEPDEREEASE